MSSPGVCSSIHDSLSLQSHSESRFPGSKKDLHLVFLGGKSAGMMRRDRTFGSGSQVQTLGCGLWAREELGVPHLVHWPQMQCLPLKLPLRPSDDLSSVTCMSGHQESAFKASFCTTDKGHPVDLGRSKTIKPDASLVLSTRGVETSDDTWSSYLAEGSSLGLLSNK